MIAAPRTRTSATTTMTATALPMNPMTAPTFLPPPYYLPHLGDTRDSYSGDQRQALRSFSPIVTSMMTTTVRHGQILRLTAAPEYVRCVPKWGQCPHLGTRSVAGACIIAHSRRWRGCDAEPGPTRRIRAS